MTTQVKAWGNGQGIRFSKELLETLEIHLNDYLKVSIEEDRIVLTKCFKHKTLEERVAECGREIEAYGEFDWGTPVGREFW